MAAITLSRWLSGATRDLCTSAMDRVCAEINEHYQAAHEKAVAEGASREAAHERAMGSLGDPAAANRGYRSVFLTRIEDQWLERARRQDRWSTGRIVGLIAGVLGTTVSISVRAFNTGSFWLGVEALAIALLLIAVGMPWVAARRTQVIPTLLPVKWAIFAVSLGLFLWSGGLGVLVSASALVYIEGMAISVRRKLPVRDWPKILHYL